MAELQHAPLRSRIGGAECFVLSNSERQSTVYCLYFTVQPKGLVFCVDTVEPDSWNVNGGTGSITPLRGQIIVRNSILVHQLLGGYMDEDQIAGR